MKQILCFGDSNTYGYIPETKGRYEFEERWSGILSKKLEKEGYRIIEEGLVGRTTVFEDELRIGRRGADLLPVLLESHNPVEHVILMLGTNDCKTFYGATAGSIGLGIRKLVRQIRDGAPSAKILLMSPIALGEKVWDGFDPEFGKNSVQVSKELPEIYRQIAEEEGLYYLAASDYAVPSERDQEHMDEEGHKALAEAVLEKISEIL